MERGAERPLAIKLRYDRSSISKELNAAGVEISPLGKDDAAKSDPRRVRKLKRARDCFQYFSRYSEYGCVAGYGGQSSRDV